MRARLIILAVCLLSCSDETPKLNGTYFGEAACPANKEDCDGIEIMASPNNEVKIFYRSKNRSEVKTYLPEVIWSLTEEPYFVDMAFRLSTIEEAEDKYRYFIRFSDELTESGEPHSLILEGDSTKISLSND